MSSETSKTALKQLNKVTYLATSIRTQKPIVNARLAALMPLIPSGDDTLGEVQPPDWDHLQNWGIGSLDASADEVRQTDHTLREVLVRTGQLRIDRRKEVKEMSSDYRAVRRSFSGVYGSSALALVGLDAEPARGMLAIQEQVGELIVRMRNPELIAVLPAPRGGQAAPDLDALTAVWEARSQRFDDLTEEIAQLHRRAQELRVLLQEAHQRSKRLYANVGRLHEGLYRLAGLDELADRMRATRRSRRKKRALLEGRPAYGSNAGSTRRLGLVECGVGLRKVV